MSESFPQIGQVFEQRYELLEIIGSGGIGTVFKARQIEADRIIALKVLHPAFAEDEEFKLRFAREAQVLALLRHVNIVSVYHLGISTRGLPYIAMELVDGVTLRKLMNDNGKGVEVQRCIKIIVQCCQALEFAHQSKIVHRDVKPENILLVSEPEPDSVKIIDFGLVHFEDPSISQSLTATGLLVGSVGYMSPEQCSGDKIDQRSDIYALTVCLYEMLSGRKPYDADTPVGVMYKHIHDPIPQYNSEEGKSLNWVIEKGMAKDPYHRFGSMLELAEALLAAGDTLSAGESPRINRVKQILPVCIILLLACMTVFCAKQILLHEPTQIDKRLQDAKSLIPLHANSSSRKTPEEELAQRISYLLASTEHKRKEYISSAEAALRLAARLPPSKRSAYYDCWMVLAGRYGNAKDYRKVIACLRPLSEMSLDAETPVGLTMQEVLNAKVIVAYAYFEIGETKQAHRLAREVAEWRWGIISGDTSYNASNILLKLGDLNAVKTLIENQVDIPPLIAICRICREMQKLDLASKSLAKAREMMETHNRLSHAYGEYYDDSGFKLEAALLLGAQGKQIESRRQVAFLLRDSKKNYGTNLEPLPFFAALCDEGMYDDAISLGLSMWKKNNDVRRRTIAFLVQRKRFSEAHALLTAEDESSDPKTGEPVPAVVRLNKMEQRKDDYTKGLDIW